MVCVVYRFGKAANHCVTAVPLLSGRMLVCFFILVKYLLWGDLAILLCHCGLVAFRRDPCVIFLSGKMFALW